MRVPTGHFFLRLLGGLCAAAGALAWAGLAWQAFSQLEEISPQSDEGGRLMRWALTGTLLMIVGMLLLHVGAEPAEDEDERVHPR